MVAIQVKKLGVLQQYGAWRLFTLRSKIPGSHTSILDHIED